MFCTKCGQENNDQNKFCMYCGSPLKKAGQAPELPPGSESPQAPEHRQMTAARPVPPASDGDICFLCGKKLNLINKNRGHFDFDRFCDTPGVSGSYGICKECTEELRYPRYILFGDESEKNYQQYLVYRTRIYRHLDRGETPQATRGIIRSRLRKLDETVRWFVDRETVLSEISSAIEKELDGLGEADMLDSGELTIARESDELTIMSFGRFFTKKDEVIRVLDRLSGMEQNEMLKSMEEAVRSGAWITRIPLSRVIYFQEKGDLSYTTSVSGGHVQSKSMSVGGAIAGKILFGNVGALIGSRVGTGVKSDGIQTTVNEHDNRYVVLRYYDEDNRIQEQMFGYDMYAVLNQLIPEKEHEYVSIHGAASANPQPAQNDMAVTIEQLKQLKELVDEGILTQEEFEQKKKQVLGI